MSAFVLNTGTKAVATFLAGLRLFLLTSIINVSKHRRSRFPRNRPPGPVDPRGIFAQVQHRYLGVRHDLYVSIHAFSKLISLEIVTATDEEGGYLGRNYLPIGFTNTLPFLKFDQNCVIDPSEFDLSAFSNLEQLKLPGGRLCNEFLDRLSLCHSKSRWNGPCRLVWISTP